MPSSKVLECNGCAGQEIPPAIDAGTIEQSETFLLLGVQPVYGSPPGVLVGVTSDVPNIAPFVGIEQHVKDISSATKVVLYCLWAVPHIKIDIHTVVEGEFGVGLVDGHVASG
jgi:hypothetical protein